MGARVGCDGSQRAHVVMEAARKYNVAEIPFDGVRGFLAPRRDLGTPEQASPRRLSDQLRCPQVPAEVRLANDISAAALHTAHFHAYLQRALWLG